MLNDHATLSLSLTEWRRVFLSLKVLTHTYIVVCPGKREKTEGSIWYTWYTSNLYKVWNQEKEKSGDGEREGEKSEEEEERKKEGKKKVKMGRMRNGSRCNEIEEHVSLFPKKKKERKKNCWFIQNLLLTADDSCFIIKEGREYREREREREEESRKRRREKKEREEEEERERGEEREYCGKSQGESHDYSLS